MGLAHAEFGFTASYNRGGGALLLRTVQTAAQGYDQAVAVDSNGRVIVVANLFSGGFLVGRFNADFTPDGSFGIGGVAAVDAAHNGDVQDVGIDSSNRIYVLASGTAVNTYVTRFNTGGSVDSGYGYRVVSTNLGPDKMSVASDGAVAVLYGSSTHGFDYAKLNSSGTILFNNFDSFESTQGLEEGHGIVFDDVGAIYVVGSSASRKMGIRKYNVSGGRDTSFNGGNAVLVDFGFSVQRAFDVVMDGSGNIGVVGAGGTQTNQAEFLLAQLSQSGAVLNKRAYQRGGTVASQANVFSWSLISSGSFYWVAGSNLSSSGNPQNAEISLFKISRSTLDFVTSFAQSGWLHTGVPGFNLAEALDLARTPATDPLIVGAVDNR